MIHRVYIGAGSNLDNRLANLTFAADHLRDHLRFVQMSPIYETAPWGYLEQGPFLNQVFEGDTDLEPNDLLVFLKNIERSLGRTISFPNGPRLIDLDILFFDRLIIKTPELEIPHPRISERAFELVPLSDLIPDFIHPVLNCSICDLLSKVDQHDIKLYEPE